MERVITPIQPPLQPGTPVRQQPTGGFTSTSNSANPTFTVLKATAIQQALGHPLAYVRVLMQVSHRASMDPSCGTAWESSLDGVRTAACLSRNEHIRQRTGLLSQCLPIPFVDFLSSRSFTSFTSSSEVCLQRRWRSRPVSRLRLFTPVESRLLVHHDKSRRGRPWTLIYLTPRASLSFSARLKLEYRAIKNDRRGTNVFRKYEQGRDWRAIDSIFVLQTLREVRCQSWGILVSHPFQGSARFCGDDVSWKPSLSTL